MLSIEGRRILDEEGQTALSNVLVKFHGSCPHLPCQEHCNRYNWFYCISC